MCALCGVFAGEAHWTEAGDGTAAAGRTRRHERLHRVALANRILRHFGLKLSDWQGSAYLLEGSTGQTSIVASVAAVWPEAEKLRRQAIDPLDERLVAALEQD
ncbi:MAG TPA: hypothetical protein VHB46_10560 [Burkholderiales bacterium]|nr:hypothetical protein [Burkholderiales bacterium]